MGFKNAFVAIAACLLSTIPQQGFSQNAGPENAFLLECSIRRVCNQEQCIDLIGRGQISLLSAGGFLIEERKNSYVKLGFFRTMKMATDAFVKDSSKQDFRKLIVPNSSIIAEHAAVYDLYSVVGNFPDRQLSDEYTTIFCTRPGGLY